MKLLRLSVLSVFLGILSSPALAANKNAYHLFNPVPRQQMREMSTDRPDKTESAYTVDAGHFQFEADMLSLIMSRDGGSFSQELLFAPVNLKVGLLNNLDFHVIVLPLSWNHTTPPKPASPQDLFSFGDMLLRLKYNLWGNDDGPTALAVMPFLKLPTSSATPVNNWFEGGVVFPFAWDIGHGLGFGAQVQMDIVSNQEALSAHPELDPTHQVDPTVTPGYHPEFSFTSELSTDITDELGAFIEFYGGMNPFDSGNPVATLDFGVTYAPYADIQWDIGFYLGLTPAAPSFNPFVGLSHRF